MSEVPSGSWDSPYLENFARHVGREQHRSGESAGHGSVSNGSVSNGSVSNGGVSNGSAAGDPAGDPTGGDPTGGDPADTDPADVHAWYTTGMELLGKGSPAAAAQVLQRAANAEPGSLSVREALARAQFDTGRYEAAAANFRAIVDASPTDDYAHFGLGLALARNGEHEAAAEYLALAAAMRPDRKPYTDALHQVRATLKSRRSSS